MGIGCGDQACLYGPLVRSYHGVTSLNLQSQIAKRKTDLLPNVKIYTLDASNPRAEWPSSVLDVISFNKVISLDCLYHLAPSRRKFLEFVFENLSSNNVENTDRIFVAEDLILGDLNGYKIKDKLLLWPICLLSGTPYRNFISIKEYEQLLRDSGFDEHWKIEITDISRNVFGGLAQFIEQRQNTLGQHIKFSQYFVFSKILRWWERTGIVNSVIVKVKYTGVL